MQTKLIVNLGQNTPIAIKSIKQATAIVQGLTQTEKMPSFSYSIPAKECKKGSTLRNIENSVFSTCYALKGNYVRYPKIMEIQYKRLKSINNPDWVNAMIFLINNKKQIQETAVFRWHDSGDLQSSEHLAKIILIAKETPNVKHWLPTKESRLIREMADFIPDNLIVRLSGSMIDGNAPKFANTSTVTTNKELATCKAFENNGKCGDCRKCWDSNIKNVTYYKH